MSEPFYWRGKPASEMTREELYEAIKDMRALYGEATDASAREREFLFSVMQK